MIENRIPLPHTVTLPPSKTCTTGTRLESLWISILEDNTATGVLREGTVCDNVSQVIEKGTKSVWTVVGGVAKAAAKRTIVSNTMVLRVARGVLATVRVLVFWAVNMKMPCNMAVKTTSLSSWAQMGVSRCNLSGVGGGATLMKGGAGISEIVY